MAGKGCGIRVVKDGNTAYVYTNDLSRESLIKAATVASHALTSENHDLIGTGNQFNR